MYDLRLSPEQMEICATIRDFVAREVKPVVSSPRHLQQPVRRIPLELLDKASQLGLRTLALSEELGGTGADVVTSCMVLEELAAGDVDLAVTFAHTSALGHALFDGAMAPAQRERYLERFLTEDRFHLSYVGREPDAEIGWGYHRPAPVESDFATSAVRHSDGSWIINGTARFVPNAHIAKLIAVQARTDMSDGSGYITLLVPSDLPGLTIRGCEDIERLPGADGFPDLLWYHGLRGEVTFRQCRVPADHMLKGTMDGCLRDESPQMGAINLGIGRAAYEAALDYAKLRVQGGRRIIEHQAIGTILANVAIKLEAARGLVWKAAWAADNPEVIEANGRPQLPFQYVAKAFTSEAVHEAALDSAECFGAMGVMRDMPLQKHVHDALVFIHGGTSNSIARFRVAEAVAGYQRVPTARG
jgi:alkylation response protein AidB-like acyl-CoA dehydrogenase